MATDTAPMLSNEEIQTLAMIEAGQMQPDADPAFAVAVGMMHVRDFYEAKIKELLRP